MLAGVATNRSQGGIQPLSLDCTELQDHILPVPSSQEVEATGTGEQRAPGVGEAELREPPEDMHPLP